MHRVIVAGSRGMTDRETIRRAMNDLWLEIGPYTVISGTARGVDSISADIARSAGIMVEEFPAEWDKIGRSAGYRRNETMAHAATHLLAIWDGASKGTKHMIDIGTREGLSITVINQEDTT